MNNNIYFKEDLAYGEDYYFQYELYISLFNEPNVAKIKNKIYNYRHVQSSAMNKKTDDAKYLHMKDMRLLSKYYLETYKRLKQNKFDESITDNTKARYILSIQAYLFDVAKYYDNLKDIKNIIKSIIDENLYPYEIPWGNLKWVRGKQWIMQCIQMLFPIEPYYLLWCRIVHILKKIKK